MQRIHHRILTYILGVSSRVSGTAAQWLCGAESLESIFWKRVYRVWIRLLQARDERFEHHALIEQFLTLSSITGSLFHAFSSMMYAIDFAPDINQLFELNWEDAHGRQWEFDSCTELVDRGKLHHHTFVVQSKYTFLHEFHSSFARAHFLDVVSEYRIRRAISRVFLSDHPLEAERDRYHTPRTERRF